MRQQSLKYFFDPHWEIICQNKWHPGTSEISTPPEIALGIQFNEQHGIKTITIFLPTDIFTFCFVSLLSGGTVKPENTYSCILKVISQVGENQKRISLNINHSYHQHQSP